MAEFGGSRHEWDAEITEQKPDERVPWRNTDGKDNTGVVTFHRLDDARTRVMVQTDLVPEGLGDSDLKRCKQLIESRGAETGGWCAEVNGVTRSDRLDVNRTAKGDRKGILGEAAGLSLGAVLAALAAVRRGKAFHPDGAVYEARLAIEGAPFAPRAAELLSRQGEHRAIARFSRAVGLPRPIPDLLGLSLRVPDAYGTGRHQDFLLVTSADYPILHHIFLPALDVQQRPYTSSLPYRAKDDLFLVGAVPQPGSPRPGGRNEFERLEAAASTGRLAFDVAVARIAGRFRPVGSLHIGRRLRHELDALRFNPWNTGGGMEPAGWLNGARDRAYKLSQGAWRRTRRDGAALQDCADRELERRELTASS